MSSSPTGRSIGSGGDSVRHADQCGYRVFLDQYVLVPGKGLATQLGTQLQDVVQTTLVRESCPSVSVARGVRSDPAL